ncbi:hypothetical protein ABZP36_013808 [Zizania latifolia]
MSSSSLIAQHLPLSYRANHSSACVSFSFLVTPRRLGFYCRLHSLAPLFKLLPRLPPAHLLRRPPPCPGSHARQAPPVRRLPYPPAPPPQRRLRARRATARGRPAARQAPPVCRLPHPATPLAAYAASPLHLGLSAGHLPPPPPPRRLCLIWARDAPPRGGVPRPAIRLRHLRRLPHAVCANAAFLAAGYSLCAVGPAALTDPPSSGEANFLGGVARVKGVKDFNPESDKYAKPNSVIGFPGALELIMECKNAGLKVAIASSADRVKVDANLAAAGLPVSL